MNVKTFPEAGEQYYEQQLANGLLVRVIPRKGFARKLAFLATDFGSNDMCFTVDGERCTVPAGTAHYLEHKMFDLPEGNAMEAFAKYGGSNNAFTNYTMTAYYVECTDCFAENLQILLRMVTTPYFTPESVEKERGIIAQEIKMYDDSADSAIFEELFAAMYHNHPVRVPIAGSVESIGEITPETLYTCHRAFYHTGNMMLCVMGDVSPEEVVRLAEENTPQSAPVSVTRDDGAAEPQLPVRARTQKHMEVSMPSFAIGFKCDPAETAEQSAVQELIGSLAAEILAGESSELYQRLYEQNVIDADFSAGYEYMRGMCMLEAAGDSNQPELVLEELLHEAARIGREGVDTAQFERLKKSMLGRRMRALDSFESTCYRVCAYHFEGVEYLDYPRLFRMVSAEDVARFLRENVVSARATLSLIYPNETGETGQTNEA